MYYLFKKKKTLLIRASYIFNSSYFHKGEEYMLIPVFSMEAPRRIMFCMHAILPIDLPLLLRFNHCTFFISLLQHLEVIL